MAKDVLSDKQIDGLIERHVCGSLIEDDAYDSMVAFARAILAAAEPAIRAEALKSALKACAAINAETLLGAHREYVGGREMAVNRCMNAIRQLGAGSKGDACKKCGGDMQLGTALAQTLTGSGDFGDDDVVTLSPGGPGKLIDCRKCVKCGWSVTVGSKEGG